MRAFSGASCASRSVATIGRFPRLQIHSCAEVSSARKTHSEAVTTIPSGVEYGLPLGASHLCPAPMSSRCFDFKTASWDSASAATMEPDGRRGLFASKERLLTSDPEPLD